MPIITWNSLAAVIAQSSSPPILFLIGLLASLFICSLSVLVQSIVRCRRQGELRLAVGSRTYQRYRQELISSPRHVGFADSILELDDRDLGAD